jgi:hypothetical protein
VSTRELHYGIVTDNVDPEMRGRVKVKCGTLVPDDTEWPDWIEPTFPYLSSSDQNKTDGGFFFVPDIGVVVELDVAASSERDEVPGQASIDAPDIKWRACVWAHGADELPSDFQTNYPNRRGIKTSLGHFLLFDDTEDTPLVRLLQHNGEGETFLEMDAAGSAMLLTSLGMMLYLNQDAGELTLMDNNQNALIMNADGLYLATADSDMLTMGGGKMQMMTGEWILNGTSANANVGKFSVSQNGTDTAVIVEGATGFQSQLASSLTEITGLMAGLGLVCAFTTGTLIPALSGGAFAATLLTSE